MKIIKQVKFLLTGVILSGCINIGFSQDATFSQYYASALYLNPAMAGTMPYLQFSSNNRTQWRSIVVPYVTNQISLIAPIYSKDVRRNHIGGIGFSFYNDRAGEGNLKANGFNLNAAYNLWLSANRMQVITFGLQAGFIQKTIDFTNLQWGSQYDPYVGFSASNIPADQLKVKRNKTYGDVGAGIMYNFNVNRDYTSKGFSGYVGFSAYHLNQPNESLIDGINSPLPILYKGHLGFEVHAAKRLNISPNVLFMMQNNIQQLNAGMYLTYLYPEQTKALAPTYVILGGWYRLNDAYIVSAGFGNDKYTLGFSYDYNASSLRTNTQGRGAYEISLSVRRVKVKGIKIFNTPRI